MFILLPIIFSLFLGIALLKIKFSNPKSLEKYLIYSGAFIAVSTLAVNFLCYDKKFVLYRLPFNIEIAFKIDSLSVFFSSIFVVVWFLVLIYSFDYMSHFKEKSRFYAFFILTIGALISTSYSANLVTLYLSFELLSLFAYVLVVHERTSLALRAGRKFIYYSLFGAGIGLIGIFYIYSLDVDLTFTAGGIAALQNVDNVQLILALTLIALIGFSCKADMFPLHSWISVTYPVSPAPAAAILSGLISKAGIIAVMRIVYYTVGTEILKGSFVQITILILSSITIMLGSTLAFREKGIKRRLAYSSVSQISYIIFGLFLFNSFGFIGAMMQVLFHALAKDVLFMFAGTVMSKTNITLIEELKGRGKQFKSLFIMFTVASLSLVGVPFTAGFVSKWYLAEGALTANTHNLGFVGIAIIMISAILTAGYLLTVVANAFSTDIEKAQPITIKKSMSIPMLILTALIIVFGIFPQPIFNFIQTISLTLNI